MNAADLTKKVKLHANDPAANLPLAPTNGKPVEDLDTKLKRLISARKCMLFMKGNPEEPKCGFSKQTVAIMKDLNASYGTFDILTDDEVRQPKKSFKIYTKFFAGSTRIEDFLQLANFPPALH